MTPGGIVAHDFGPVGPVVDTVPGGRSLGDGSNSWRCAMRALVVYESMYGNTKHVAEAIVEGLRQHVVNWPPRSSWSWSAGRRTRTV
jgi:hypothetical protein